MNLMPAEVLQASASGVKLRVAGDTSVIADVDGSSLKVGDKVTLGLRAEHVLEAGEGSEIFHCDVQVVEHLGESNYIYAALADGSEVVLRGDGDRTVALGVPLSFSTPSSAFHVFDAQGQAMRRLHPGNMVASSRGRSTSTQTHTEGLAA